MHIPTTVETMAIEIKKILDDAAKHKITALIAFNDLQALKQKRPDLFIAALTDRWIGKKRIKQVIAIFPYADQSMMGG